MHDFFLPNPLNFLWEVSYIEAFGRGKHEFKPLGIFYFESLSLHIMYFQCVASKCSIENFLRSKLL
jgi:hypothetical protein